jgi:uncharacterized protein YjdB
LNKTVNWSSENEDIATVTSAGIVSAVAAGTVDVIATAADGGGAADTISVTVTDGTVTVPDPIAWYKFEGDATDAAGNHDGAIQNSPSYSTDSREGSNSISLASASSQWVDINFNDFEDPFSKLTVTGWIKANGTSNTQVIYEEGGSWKGLSLRLNNNQLEARAREDNQYNLDVSTSFTATAWTHVAVRFDNGNIELFVDGSSVANNSTTNFTTVNSHNNGAGIGAINGGDVFNNSANYFDGLIDDIRVYEDALTDAQIQSIYDEAGTIPTQYTLTTSASNGDITLDPSGGEYDADTDVEATANADDGYEFVDWEGAATGSTNPVTITMDAEKSLTANFTAILVSSVTIDEGATLALTVDGDDDTLSVNILPGDALNQTVNWSSENEDIATVTSAGIVSAVAAGTVDVIATAADGGGAADTISVTVTDAPLDQTPYGGTPWAVPGKIEAEDYDEGGENIAYYDGNSGNSGGAYRSDNVDIQSTSDAGGGYNVGWTSNGEWLEYTVDVANSGTYTIEIRTAGTSNGTIEISFNDGAVTTGDIALAATGGWQTWTTVQVTGISLTAGQQIMRIDEKSGGFNLNYVNIVAESTPTQESMTFVQSASYDMEGASLHSTWCSDCNYGSVDKFILNSNYSHFILGVDISSLPSDATIDSVELTVYNQKTLYGGSSVSSEVRATTASFDEDVVTYDAFSGNIDGTSTGLLGTLALTAPAGNPQTDAEIVVPSSANFVSAAQAAHDGDRFFGLAVLTDPNQNMNYHSDDASTASLRPVIRIVYTTNKDAEASFENIAGNASMLVYPNPAANGQGINIELKGFENETDATISIIDISGRIAYTTNVQTRNIASQREEISLDGLSAGMYMVVVRSSNKVINQRLIIR